MTGTRFYSIYRNMKLRCYRKKNDKHKYYYDKGVTICDRWLKLFKYFKDDMHESYLKHVKEYGEKNTTIDRIDTNKGYYKENCRWATLQEQNDNRSNTIYVYYGNSKYALPELCRIENKDYYLVYKRIKRGWNIFQALFTSKGEKIK